MTPEEILEGLNTTLSPAVTGLTASVANAITALNEIKIRMEFQTGKVGELFDLVPADVTFPDGYILPNFAKVREDLTVALTAFTSIEYLHADAQAVDSAKLEGKTLEQVITNIKAQITGLAPAALDTFEELAARLENDADTVGQLLSQLADIGESLMTLTTALDGKAPASHTHSDYAATGHTHDDRYHTKIEMQALLDEKADVGAVSAGGVSQILKPTILTPTNGATNFTGAITASYATTDAFVGAQDFVHWQLSDSSSFATIVDSYEGVGNLTSWTPSAPANTSVYVRVMQGSDNHRSEWSSSINYTTPNIYIQAPTLSVTGTSSDVPETPTLTAGTFSVSGGSDTYTSTDFEVRKTSDNSLVWSTTHTGLSTSIPSGSLQVSTSYKFRARHNGTTYGSSAWTDVVATTKSAFVTYSNQGELGFSVAPTTEAFAVLSLAEMTGTTTVGHDNYGNYIHTNGSIVCWMPRMWYRIGHTSSPRYATYGANAIDMVPASAYANEAAANADGYVLHRAFIDGGSTKSGFFIDKYINSKSGSAAVSVKNGAPISLTTSTSFTNSNGMISGCTGILADAVYLARARGAWWNVTSVFMRGWLALCSLAQAQAADNTTDCAWYDATGVKNFPKGCNSGSLTDTNDNSVTFTSAGDSGASAKPKAGSGSPFAKTTHNGANNGVADVNGSMFQVDLGLTSPGTNATDAVNITSDLIYVLKQSAYLKDLTGGFGGSTDAWGTSANLVDRYDAITSPIAIGSSIGVVHWGNGTNAVLSNATSGAARDLCGFFFKDSNSVQSSGGSNLFGNDYFYKYNIANMFVLSCGNWDYTSAAGLFCRYLTDARSDDAGSVGFRSSAYV